MSWTCTHEENVIGLHIFQDGSLHVVKACVSCGKHGGYLPNSNYDLNALPVLKDDSEKSYPCAVSGCTNSGAQLHHVAPRHLFKTDSNKWPQIFLCKEHHQEWHEKVTPNMSRGTNER